MKRGKRQPAAAEPDDAATMPSAKKAHGKDGATTGKLSREAMRLLNANSLFTETVTSNGSGQRVACKARSRASAPNPDSSPSRTRRQNGKSAPPLPDGQAEILCSPPTQDPDVNPGGKAPKNKRTAVEGQDSKRRKMARSSDPSSEQALPEAAPKAPAAAAGVQAYGTCPTRDHKLEDVEMAPDSMPVAKTGDHDLKDAPTGGSKKSRAAHAQSAAAALEGPAACNTSPGNLPDTEEPRGRSQGVAVVGIRQSAAKDSPAAGAPAGHMAQPPLAAPATTTAPSSGQAANGGANAAPDPAARGGLAAAGASGPGMRVNATEGEPRSATALPGPAEADRQLPPTGTTPVKPFLPIPMPRLDEVGRHDRIAVVELQRQLAEVRALYDELKATKIGDLERVLAEQTQYTDEQVRLADHRAELWKAAAEHAEVKLKEVTGQEAAERMAALEARNLELLKETSLLMRRVAQLEKELVLAQQAFHDARAELMQSKLAPEHQEDIEGDNRGDVEEADQLSHGDACDDAVIAEGQGVDAIRHPAAEAAPQPEEPSARNAIGAIAGNGDAGADAEAATRTAGRSPGHGVGVQFPTPSPGANAQFQSPSLQLGLLGAAPESTSHDRDCGLSTACQRIVSMLPSLRAPSPSVQSGPGTGLFPRTLPTGSGEQQGLMPGSSNQSREWGVSTECQRAVEMLPSIRVPSPSIPSCFTSRAIPSAAGGQLVAGNDVTPTTVNGGAGEPDIQPGSKRRSTGSPIDGLCGSGQRRIGAASITDLSHAHGMGAPEAFAVQQEQYSFVDLNPASAHKAPRPLPANAQGEAHVGHGADKDRVQPNGGTNLQADLLAAAAATALPLSPANLRQDAPAGAGASVNGCVPPSADTSAFCMHSPVARITGILKSQVKGAPPPAPDSAAAIIRAGSVESNQGSCNMPGIVARAMAQRQEAQRLHDSQNAATPPSGDASPSSARKAAAQQLPLHAQAPAGADGATLATNAPENVPLSFSAPPRTVIFKLMEAVLGWKLDVVPAGAMETYRLTHRTCGMSFELLQTEVEDDDISATEDAQAGLGDPEAFFEYTPVDLGAVAEILPSYLKESIVVPAEQLGNLLDKIHQAVCAVAKRKKAQ